MSAVNPLSAEFLYELYATALRQEPLCAVLARHMHKEYPVSYTHLGMKELKLRQRQLTEINGRIDEKQEETDAVELQQNRLNLSLIHISFPAIRGIISGNGICLADAEVGQAFRTDGDDLPAQAVETPVSYTHLRTGPVRSIPRKRWTRRFRRIITSLGTIFWADRSSLL